MLLCFYVIASTAKSAFENLKKNYTKKQSNLRNSKNCGTLREAVEKAESELWQWCFLRWLDDFMQPQASWSSFHVNCSQQSQQSQQPIEEINNFLDDEEEDDFMEDDENDEFDKPEDNFQISQVIMKDTASERQKWVNVQTKIKQPIAKKKLAAMKESELEQQKLTFLKSVKKRMESRDKRKKIDDPEDRFLATIIDDRRQLPYWERLLAKNEINDTLFRYQLQILDKQNATQGNFNDQNVNNRNSFVSQLKYQLPLPINSSHGNSFPIQQPQKQNYSNLKCRKHTSCFSS